jgi:predicted O-methyltransferase YrrM
MPLARTFDAAHGKIVTTVRDAYLDRLSRWSDIREYLAFLYEQARTRPGCRVLELGSRRGNSTLAFLAAAEESGGHVWSCDIEDVRRYPDGIGPFGRSPQWTFTCGDDLDPDVQARLPAGVDVLFVDTSHEYAATLAECRVYVPRVVPGGIALFHDTKLTGWPGYEWDGDTPPVRQALDDYCAEAGLSWEELPGRYGLGIIRP